MINIYATESAISKIKEVTGGDNDSKLRIFIEGGGCAGFNYGFTLDSNVGEDDYRCTVAPDIEFLIDSMSATYLDGSTIDYKEEFLNSQFTVENPNAASTCGCGSSFTI